ncbi:3-oxoacyl-ACP synthase III family protein [Actinomadura chibensis]|nr:ketoacyl-ACP synthase III [Actinomadura chibensis]
MASAPSPMHLAGETGDAALELAPSSFHCLCRFFAPSLAARREGRGLRDIDRRFPVRGHRPLLADEEEALLTKPRMDRIGIVGTGSRLPSRVMSNADVADVLGVERRWIQTRTGIRERRFAGAGEGTAALAAGATMAAVEAAGLTAADVDTVIVATSTPDRPIPPVATRVQELTGAGGALSFDVNAACAGFLYGLAVAGSLLAADDQRRYAVVVGSDTYSRLLNPADRQTYAIFGDGAGAVVLGRVDDDCGLLHTRLNTDGSLGDIAVGGPQLPISVEQIEEGAHFASMRGHRVAEVVRTQFPMMIKEVVAQHGISVERIDHLVCHQANPRLIQECATAAGFTPRQLVMTGDVVGNTASASIPIGLAAAAREGRLRRGDTILMVSFGAGMTWGWSLLRWA